MDTITKSFLKKKLTEYYSENEVYLPREFRKREWAFVPADSLPEFVMQRHLAFDNELELKGYLLKNPPAHAYFSSAYYEKPDAERMDEKGWIKADLIFDIDADHLPKQSLAEAKKQIVKLYDILESDFGISNMMIVFSGGRGYHIHVHDKEFLELDSGERREIVDYLTLNGIVFSEVFPESTQYGRITKCMVKRLRSMLRSGNVEEFFSERKKARQKVLELIERRMEKISSGDFRGLSKSVLKGLSVLFKSCVENLTVHVDPPVTADVKRLIRLPFSIHSKTSLRVTPISRDEIAEFKPSDDAVAFGEEKVKVRVLSNVKFKLKGQEFRLKTGKYELPEYAGIYLICRKKALYGW